MPLSTKKSDGKVKVVDPSGKVFGTHESKKKAVKQIQAINISKARAKGADIPEKNKMVNVKIPSSTGGAKNEGESQLGAT